MQLSGRNLICLLVLAAAAPAPLSRAEAAEVGTSAPRVFFDCDDCDFSYIRQEIPFVNWVRDREDAVLHLLINSISTASGGREYKLDFIGLQRRAGTQESLTYVAPPDFTEDEEGGTSA